MGGGHIIHIIMAGTLFVVIYVGVGGMFRVIYSGLMRQCLASNVLILA